MECCLGKSELMRISGGDSGVLLRCLKGTLWVTIGDGIDYLVYHGRSLELSAGTPALVEALGPAEMRVEPAATCAPTMRSISLQPVH